MLELYSHPMSPCAQKVRLVLEEKKLEYIKHHVDLQAKANLQPEYLLINPLGVVPSLVHDGFAVIESSIICEYLDDYFPEPVLKPGDAYRRSKMRFWMKHVDNKLHPACGALQWPLIMRPKLMEKTEIELLELLEKIPEKPRRERQKRLVKFGLDAPDVSDAVLMYRNTILDMEAVLKDHLWVVDNDFSLADICLAPYFQTIFQFGWDMILQDCPKVLDWFNRCRKRLSFETAIANDFNEETQKELLAIGALAWPKIQSHLQLK